MENIQVLLTILHQSICNSFVFIFIYFSYVYQEGEVKMVGNHVVSCLVDNFKGMGYFSNPYLRDISIFSDNFVGQKNKYCYMVNHLDDWG